MALCVGAGDEVITVTYTWISTAEVISLLGAKPIFVDIRPDTWNMDESQLEAATQTLVVTLAKVKIPTGPAGQFAVKDWINPVDIPLSSAECTAFPFYNQSELDGLLAQKLEPLPPVPAEKAIKCHNGSSSPSENIPKLAATKGTLSITAEPTPNRRTTKSETLAPTSSVPTLGVTSCNQLAKPNN